VALSRPGGLNGSRLHVRGLTNEAREALPKTRRRINASYPTLVGIDIRKTSPTLLFPSHHTTPGSLINSKGMLQSMVLLVRPPSLVLFSCLFLLSPLLAHVGREELQMQFTE
jgi:hypothetical protein